MKKGYIKLLTDAVELQNKIKGLNDVGVESSAIMISDDISQALQHLSEGDQFYVTRLSELGTSISQVFAVIAVIHGRRAAIHSVEESWINDLSADAKFPHLITVLNELNAEIISKRTRTALQQAVKAGKTLGRPVGSRKKRT